MKDDRVQDVVVIGGGITGLAATYTLQRSGADVLLLEAAPEWGGVIRTETVDGFLIEGGPDSILAQKPEGIALCREVGIGDRLTPTNGQQRAVYVLLKGKLHPLPEGMALAVPTRIPAFLRSTLFSWPGKLRMGLDLVIPNGAPEGDESIASFLRRRFGDESVARLGEPLLAGIHAGDPERLSINATFPRFAQLEKKHGSLVRGMWKAMPKRPASAGPPPAAFYAPRGGLREMVDAVVERIPAACLRSRFAVASIARDEGGFTVRSAEGEAVRARTVVVACPANRAADLLEPLTPEAAPLLRGIPFASSATVALGFRREDVGHPLDGYGLVVPATERLRTSALSFVSTKFPGRAPEGSVLLRGFLGGTRDPRVLEKDDAAMVELVVSEMRGVLGLRGTPTVTRVYRWPQGTPQMEVGHFETLARIEAAVARVPGLVLAGAGLRGTGIPDCVADGQKAAAAVSAVLAGVPVTSPA